ncbi:GPR1/FUN34/YaaH family transporter [Actinacidiphila acidipaludis]|uniref:Acetate uptake transporter family protein n=1 Tax=Actinacidiphila acidipaludis TaxID=2873382 RepID=A0ABS7QGD1_9ACTN|nr:GPR1/FUN34/YaaH family transporter [Streptomyces acidipaludis]MBY8882220.1 acetate uptake transporter family protein [Streptomyces acidipaludis]
MSDPTGNDRGDGYRPAKREVDGAAAQRRGPDPEALTRIMLRPIASSLPLGFFAFGTGSVLLTTLELRWAPQEQSSSLMLPVLVFVVPLEVLAAVFAFLARDAGAACALAVFAGVWAGSALMFLRGQPGETSPALAVFLLTVAPLMLVLAVASLQGKPLFGALLVIGAARFVLIGAYEAGGPGKLQTVAGWMGVALGVFALYGGLALLLEDGAQRTVLPLARRGRARGALEGDLAQQLARTEGEAGVRRQL